MIPQTASIQDAANLPLSVVIPIGPAEQSLEALSAELRLLPAASQVVLAYCPASKTYRDRHLQQLAWLGSRLIWVDAEQGRAQQLNAGAGLAEGEFLWFLHADSRITPWVVDHLQQAMQMAEPRLHYFQLAFASDGQGPTWLNAQAANWRSRWLGVPFGDQGFAMPRQTFQILAGFDQQARYGEDHLLVWRAKRRHIRLQGWRSVITTSARKYRSQGWGQLTLRYQWWWIKQALPQCWLWLTGR